MTVGRPFLLKRMLTASILLLLVLVAVMYLGLSIGSTGGDIRIVFQTLIGEEQVDSTLDMIIWRIRTRIYRVNEW